MWLLSFDSLPPPSTMPSIFILPPSLPLGQSEERSDGSSSGAGSGPGESCFATERQRCRFLNFISPTKTFFFYYQTNNLYKFGRWVKLFQNLWMKPVMMCQSRWFGVFFWLVFRKLGRVLSLLTGSQFSCGIPEDVVMLLCQWWCKLWNNKINFKK